MTIAELTGAIADLRKYYDFDDNADIRLICDARSNKNFIDVHVRPSDDVEITLTKRIDLQRPVISKNYTVVKNLRETMDI